MDLDRLHKNFEVMQDWQDRYRFIIELGKKIPEVPSAQQTDEYRVHGCMSTVHMVITEQDDGRVEFIASSDAAIVNGLIALLHIIYDGKTATEMAQIDIDQIFGELGLDKHISPNRRNGFFSMVERLKSLSTKGA